MRNTLLSIFIFVAVLISAAPVRAEKFGIDVYSNSTCDTAFLGRQQVSSIDPSITCKVRVHVTHRGAAVTNRRIVFSERLTSGAGASTRKKTDVNGNVTFSFKVGEAVCYFQIYDARTSFSRSLVTLLNSQGACGV